MPTISKDTGNASVSDTDKSYYSSPAAVTLPKGGGAIKGMGEKFAANPVTGTGSMTVPIATSPGRSGFGPQLSLSYDSGAGNGPFGFGWSLSLPSITRKTDKGIPRYEDAENSDVFILSGAEDLVPTGETVPPQVVNGITYSIQRYRPRIEGLFARIECWKADSGETHWRSTTRDNITTLYGKNHDSKIFDPKDPNTEHPTRIFSWLICESYDDRGNRIVYEYKPENLENIDPAQAHEKNRLGGKVASANRYLKFIKYGNQTPGQEDWLFQVTFDYSKPDSTALLNNPQNFDLLSGSPEWWCRPDAFSSYRAGFEVRTYRLCRRVLMFHRFTELGTDWTLVRSTDLTYQEGPISTYLIAAKQTGYVKKDGKYTQKSLPSLEFTYSEVKIDETVQEVDRASLENLPIGLDGRIYQWVDLDSEGISGILTQQGNGWFHKRNLGNVSLDAVLNQSTPPEPPESNGNGHGVVFAPLELVSTMPATANLQGGRQQLLDLAGDGSKYLAEFSRPLSGFYERTPDGKWKTFQPFESLPNIDWNDSNLRFVDLNGDGHADVLITEQEVFTWYPSLAKVGFGAAQHVPQSWDEEQGPRLVFSDGTQSIYLTDMSGDGLVDLARIQNGEVCYWPNLGYGRFGAKVTMDNAPWFDNPEMFDHKRIRVGDVDGSGTTDIFYLQADRITLWLNQSGNRWSQPQVLPQVPPMDDLSSVTVVDLLGNGTACLVWSSALPGDALQPMRYIDLMGGQKPHLIIEMKNNLGARTKVQYTASTKFYLQDRAAGKPWITHIPFPVHVVERVETWDEVTGNRFATSYRYHHGYFDGVEREFRGFGCVEQWDTETYQTFQAAGGTNVNESFHVPPVYTKTWFHTGAFIDRDHISNFFAEKEYYREPQHRVPPGAKETQRRQKNAEFQATLLPDTILPPGLTAEEQREACRSLKGRILRQEVYGVDHSPKSSHPYSVSERSYEIRRIQEQGQNRHGVFFTYDLETINYYYERNLIPDPTDPESDLAKKQQVLDPRVAHQMTLEMDEFGNVLKSVAIAYPRRHPLHPEQAKALITYTANQVLNKPSEATWYRIGVPIETLTYELTGYLMTGNRFQAADFVRPVQNDPDTFTHIFDSEINYEDSPTNGKQRRLIERVRSLYRKNADADRTDPTPLALGEIDSLALPYESYKLAFTSTLLNRVLVVSNKIDGNGLNTLLKKRQEAGKDFTDGGGYVELDGAWWIPSGRQAFDPQRFYLPVRFKDPFKETAASVEQTFRTTYDSYGLFVVEIKEPDPIANVITIKNNYRVLQPEEITDPNGNRSQVAFDALGMVVGTAVMGKATGRPEGDVLEMFNPDLPQADITAFFEAADPRSLAITHLGMATTRFIYDLEQVPACAAAIARTVHVSDLQGDPLKPNQVQVSFVYSDGFGREAQTKVQAEPADRANPVLRWVGTGTQVYNNKGKPVRQYEPFFSDTHKFGIEQLGVSSTLFYDPLERVVATLHPNHTYEKVVFDAWRQETWDVNDTVAQKDPRQDPDVGEFFKQLPPTDYLPTWYTRYNTSQGANEQRAASKAMAHAETPTTAHLDVLGRPFLTIARNGKAITDEYSTHVMLDIEGNQREITDACGKQVMVQAFDLLGHGIHSNSVDAGERWILNNVAGKPIRRWDSRGQTLRMEYDGLQRPTHVYVHSSGQEILAESIEYGEGSPNAADFNLRGRVFKQFDGAGKVETMPYDFKGNLCCSTRTFFEQYQDQVDWNAPFRFAEESFTGETFYDALNRPIRLLTPRTNVIPASVIQPTYSEANLLEKVEVQIRGEATWTTFVSNIDYNEKGQRVLIEYGMQDRAGNVHPVKTEYFYDSETFRLVNLKTTRPSDHTVLQNLNYTYDPVGNITAIRDDAQQTVFFQNDVVSPSTQYTYDALYRLILAEGREHVGQNPNAQPDHSEIPCMDLPHANDLQAMRRYRETYEYDRVGNILAMIHRAMVNSQVNEPPVWTRRYNYGSDNNRLLGTSLPGDAEGTFSASYDYDEHGNMTTMPHLPKMEWDFKDQLHKVTLQRVNDGDGTTAYYVYDASGQRVRKVVEKGAGREERIYLGGFEIFRRYNGTGLKLERETLHVMDDKQRIALVETKTFEVKENGTGGIINRPKSITRYQLDNHLGSAVLELDETGKVISYEEYHPYGTTSYQAGDSAAEVSLKRYRYAGKERDEESGFYYHGARYYAPWLGRWISCDPLGIIDLMNLYGYARNNPVKHHDPTGQAAKVTIQNKDKNKMEDRKVIVQLNLLFYPTEEGMKGGLDQKFIKESISPKVKEAIETYWHKENVIVDGKRFSFEVKVNVEVYKDKESALKASYSRSDLHDVVGLTIPESGYHRSYVDGSRNASSTRSIGSIWDLYPDHDHGNPGRIYAHEAGHLMGLSDDYYHLDRKETDRDISYKESLSHKDHLMGGGSTIHPHEVQDIIINNNIALSKLNTSKVGIFNIPAVHPTKQDTAKRMEKYRLNEHFIEK